MPEHYEYPQDQEANEYRYISPAWLDAIAEGLTKGAVKHPGETWRQIQADEHLARALRHINLYRMGDRSEPHIINASMRIMMAFEMAAETTAETTAERTTGADKTAGLKPCRCGTDSYPASTCGTIWNDLPAWRIFCPTCGATTGLSTGYGAAVIEWNKMQSEKSDCSAH